MNFNIAEIFRIAKTSAIKAFEWKIWKWLATSSIGALSSTLFFGEKFFNLDGKRSIAFGLVTLLLLYMLRFLLIFMKESLKYYHEVYKNSTYGDAIVILKDCFAEVHYYRKTPGFREEEFMKSMMLFCNSLKTIYDTITNSNCSVSIKVPVSDKNVLETTVLKNLTRDSKHLSRDTEVYTNIKHTIIGNSAFNNCLNKVITNKAEKYYLNNSVNKTANYLNTSKSCYENEVLPYNSELVHPISPKKSLSKDNFDCHGFICIDSNIENAFDTKYATAILEGVSDGIFDLVCELNTHKQSITDGK